jgi:hypothetical protein
MPGMLRPERLRAGPHRNEFDLEIEPRIASIAGLTIGLETKGAVLAVDNPLENQPVRDRRRTPPATLDPHSVPIAGGAPALRPGALRHSMAIFLASLVAMLIVVPLVAPLIVGELVEAALLTLVLASSALAAGGRGRDLIAASILALSTIAGKWLNQFQPDLCPAAIYLIAGMALLGFVLTRLLRFILRAPCVDSEVLCAGLSGYLLLGVLWTFAYTLTAQLVPGSFAINAGPDSGRALNAYSAMYFSFITLCTVGYGDILPVSHVARMLASLEAICGTIFMTVLIARLVGLYSSRSVEQRGAAKNPSRGE